MAFVRKVNGYWVLEHTVRTDKGFVKKTRYIGKDLPGKAELEEMKKELLSGTRRFGYISAEELAAIEEKRASYLQEDHNRTTQDRERASEEFMIRFTYDSSKLSGLEVTLRQTYLILKEGIIPKDMKVLRQVREIENQKKGFLLLTSYRGPLTLPFMRKLHKVLMSGVDDEIAGMTRDVLKRNVKIAGTSYVPPKWDSLEKEVQAFFAWYKSDKKHLHTLELSALIHLRLISMQPFSDGNSRLSRLLMNWILWKRRYPLIDIPIEDIEEYYNALDRFQVEKDEKPFVRYIIKRYLDSKH